MARICITRTQGEWDIIVAGMKNGLSHYIRMECSTLIDDFKDCPLCITPASGDKIERQFRIPDDVYKELEKISKTAQRPISSIIDDFIISPLLLPK